MAIDDFRDSTKSKKASYPEELKDELTFNFNSFQVPQVEEEVYALCRLILNLLLTEPGTYPDMPNLGINLAQYQFEFLDESTMQKIQRHIKQQIDLYIPNSNIGKLIVAKSPTQKNVIVIGITIIIDLQTNKTQNAFIMVDEDLNSYIQYS